MDECPNCGFNLPDTYELDTCVNCGELLVEEDELLMDVDNAKVLERSCTCGETFYILYQEKEASLDLDLIASKLGLGGSYNTIEPKVIGTHSVTCPLCGSELTIAQMAKMKIAAMLFGDPFSSDEAPRERE